MVNAKEVCKTLQTDSLIGNRMLYSDMKKTFNLEISICLQSQYAPGKLSFLEKIKEAVVTLVAVLLATNRVFV